MRVELIWRSSKKRQPTSAAIDAGLLDLFAPTRLPPSTTTLSLRSKHTQLWREDAIHRAKNMAQLASSLANVVDRPSQPWFTPGLGGPARRLARTYDELGVDDTQAHVPCATLLTEIAIGLSEIFAGSRQMMMVVSTDAIYLPGDIRRALLLVCSELIINALKYGFPQGTGGTISVTLANSQGGVELIVEDNGIGIAEAYSAGHGGRLLEQLTALLDATMTRTTTDAGHGYRVSTVVPTVVPNGPDN